MSSVQPQRKWIKDQLTAAEETEFKEIIVKSEEEMDNERRLLDFSRLPRIILHRIDLPQCCVSKKEEVFTELNNQDGDSTLHQEKIEPLVIKKEQEEPEHLEIKHEQEELEHLEIKHEQEEPEHLEIKHEQEEPEHLQIKLFKVEENQPFSSQDEEQLVLKQETGDILVTPSNVQRNSNKTEPNRNQKMLKKSDQDQNLFACKICDKTFSVNNNLKTHEKSLREEVLFM
ncbi:involucrin-like [Poeciliopsis prolifica]|uniref:involucrin-like n=1 Tax=Poeciliopsis prolifica TaxID=188132 RepID=UPI002413F7EE|nr:involucrin-like [Poeciliopsis prolifica]